MTASPTRISGHPEPLPAPTPGPAALTLALELSAGEAACLTALAARWQWQPAHVAAHLLSAELYCRFMDDQEHTAREVAP